MTEMTNVRTTGQWTPRHQQILNNWANRVLANIYADPERREKFESYMERYEEENTNERLQNSLAQ